MYSAGLHIREHFYFTITGCCEALQQTCLLLFSPKHTTLQFFFGGGARSGGSICSGGSSGIGGGGGRNRGGPGERGGAAKKWKAKEKHEKEKERERETEMQRINGLLSRFLSLSFSISRFFLSPSLSLSLSPSLIRFL